MTLKQSAYQYWKQGLNIILVKNKKPLVEWQQWQKQRQIEKEFDNLSWDQADGFAVLCGTQTEHGYFCAVDYDVKNLPNEIVEKGKEILKGFLTTQMERTQSGGIHLVFWSKQKPKTTSSYHNIAALELLGTNKLCIMAPSKGYTRLNDNLPTIVENLEFVFFKALEKSGIDLLQKKRKQAWFDIENLTVRGFKGKYPPCIFEMLKGVKEGLRNQVAIRLSSYFVNFCKIEPVKAYNKIQKWNKLNEPPLEKGELEDIFQSSLHGYNFGCTDDILKSFCNPAKCPLVKKQGKEKPQQRFSENVEASIQIELQRILEGENQLEALKPHLDNVIMGEDENKQAVQVLLSGSKYADAKKKQIILLKGTEGGGKTTLARELAINFKVKEVGRFSSHALDYSNLEGFEVLFLKELGAMDMEKQGVSTLKFLSADDRGYMVEVTVRDEETGKFTTEQHKIPCMTVISTTTRLILDPQFERRAWLFNVDETKEQTKNILEWKADQKRQEDEKLLGIRKVTDYEFSGEVLKRFFEQLKPQKIIIPFRKTLNDVLQADVLRIRGDVDKLHSFVELYGLLNLKRLEKANSDVYAVTPEVCIDALKIIVKPLTQMLSKIDERTKTILNTLKDLALNKAQDVITKTERERIAVKIGKSERTVLSYLNFLENVGFLSSDSKKPKTFTLLYSVETIMEKLSGISAKLESADDLVSKMEKEAQEWLSSTSEIKSLRDTQNFLMEDSEKLNRKQQDTIKKFMPIPGETISDLELSQKQASLTEKPSEDLQIEKLQIIQADSWILKREGNKITAKDGNILYECQFCRGLNNPMFFNSEEDLKLHILRLHSGYPNSKPNYVS